MLKLKVLGLLHARLLHFQSQTYTPSFEGGDHAQTLSQVPSEECVATELGAGSMAC